MDYLADDNFNAYQQDDDAPEYTHTDADAQNISSPEQLSKRDKVKAKLKSGRWRGLSAFSSSTAVQDKLLEKLVSSVMPTPEQIASGGAAPVRDAANPPGTSIPPPYESTRPPFSIPLMSNNFRRFNARIGVVFKFQSRFLKLLSWRQPSHTLSFLAVYSLICLDPYLLTVLPLAALLFGVLIPAFMTRHPPEARELGYSPHGPPRAPPGIIRPVKELSKEFFKNMGDLQNSMEDFSRGHDQVVEVLVPKTNFSDEALSSALFVALFALTLFMSVASHLLPWKAIALCGGWGLVVSNHPVAVRVLQEQQAAYFAPGGEGERRGEKAQSLLDSFVSEDIILDSDPETREVEIFELQHLESSSGEWEPWVFSPSPYDPLSQARITGERPQGTRFFEDVRAPEGWEWSEKKWALDLWSREWVEERIITGVEVETEGERWVYDLYDETERASGVREEDNDSFVAGSVYSQRKIVSWEEGEEGGGRRGKWRRRRWVRLVQRKFADTAV
ncbi:Peroxisome size and maintenance regulator [Cytospora paraplurivora]|uniref:Peroxisome size and maintenance regulator n=1 Tax=Cytospora paraplurivora TaxID=2898453 RepID=A0AAN9U643_9PEZI